MIQAAPTMAEILADTFADRLSGITDTLGQVAIDIPDTHWLDVCRQLRDDPTLNYEQLIDLSAVDYMSYGDTEWDTTDVSSEGFSRAVEGEGAGRFSWENQPAASDIPNRFAVVVQLLSIKHNRRLRLRCFASDETLPIVPSLVEIWNSANWYEREAFDLMGIVFEGHPDLRRLLTDYGFVGHPFRKDFPLIGNVTVRYDEEQARVVYEPVEIEPRVLVPRVVRSDSRYFTDDIDEAAETSADDFAGGNGNV